MASCFLMRAMLPYLIDVARGYPFYPNLDNGDDEIGKSLAAFSGYTESQIVMLDVLLVMSSILVVASIVYRDDCTASRQRS